MFGGGDSRLPERKPPRSDVLTSTPKGYEPVVSVFMALADETTGHGIDESLTPLHWIGIAAAAVTGIVHLYLGVQIGGTFGTAFLVATVGFAAGIAAVVLNYRRTLVYLLGIPFTAGQVVMWYAFNDVPPIPTSHAIDKAAQVVLVVALVVLLSRER